MDWAGVAKLAGILAILSLVLLCVWIIYKQGKKIGKEEGKIEEEKRVDNATDKLAESLYSTSGDFRVLHPDEWGKPPDKT